MVVFEVQEYYYQQPRVSLQNVTLQLFCGQSFVFNLLPLSNLPLLDEFSSVCLHCSFP